MLAHIGIIAVGRLADKIVGIGSPRGTDDLLQSSVLLCKAYICQDTARKKEGLLQHNANLRVQAFHLYIPQVAAVQKNFPLVYVIKPHNQIDEGRLSRAGGANQADHLPGFHRKADIFQHRLIGLVAEGHIFKAKSAFDGKRFAVLFVRQQGFLIQHIIDTIQAGHHLHHLAGQMSHPAQRPKQIAAVGHKLHQLAHRHFSLQHMNAAEIDGNIGSHSQKEGQNGEKRRPKGLVLLLHRGKILCFLRKSGALPLLLPKGLHYAHSGYDILQAAAQIIKFQPLSVENGPDMMPEGPGYQHNDNDKNQGQQGHLPADYEHHHQGYNHCHKGGKHVAKHTFHKLPDLPGVPGDTVHQLSRPSVVDKGQGQSLNLMIKLPSQTHADGSTQLGAKPIAPDKQRKAAHQQRKADAYKPAKLGEGAAAVRQRLVDKPSLHHRSEKAGCGNEKKQHRDQQQPSHKLPAQRHKLFQHIRLAVAVRTLAGSWQRPPAFFAIFLVFPAGDPVRLGELPASPAGVDNGLGAPRHIGDSDNMAHGKTRRAGGAAVPSKDGEDSAVDLMLTLDLLTVRQLIFRRFCIPLQHRQAQVGHYNPGGVRISDLRALFFVVKRQVHRHTVPDCLPFPQRKSPLLRLA